MNENSSTPAELCIGPDIAEQKRAEEEITARENRYRRTIAGSGQLLREYDVDTGGMRWGDCLARVLRYSVDEMEG
ncbi:MAG: hypothetical protein ABSG44_05305 [Thermodesulfobacteriota bacterium]|jgi:PAS domain-containing protein